jgi:hypothetical protein
MFEPQPGLMAMPYNVWSKKTSGPAATAITAEHLQALYAMAAPDSVTGPSGEGRIDEFALPGYHLDDGADQDGTADRNGSGIGSIFANPEEEIAAGIAR